MSWRSIALVAFMLLSACRLIPPSTGSGTHAVRGYIAVAVGNSAKAEAGGIYSRAIAGKDVYLPGVTVYLQNAGTGTRSNPTRTDLSGRFTLYAADKERYRICWESKVYDSGCTTFIYGISSTPQFVSTVNIRVPPRQDYVAMIGRVTMADGSVPRTFDPLLNINSFAMVGLDDASNTRLADVYVNNFGEYLLPYVPVKQKVGVVARIESAQFAQEVRPEAQIEVERLHRVNLRFENYPPRVDPLIAIDPVNLRRVQVAAPGSKVRVSARARDNNGDPVAFAWFLDDGDGQLSSTTGATVDWTLPSTPGRYTVTVVGYDNKGGYDKAVLAVQADTKGIPFTGIVVEPNGTPVANAIVEIVGNPGLIADAGGRFQTTVKEADRYVLNIRKQGYALNSHVYDRSVTGGRWILRRAQVVTINPTVDSRITHERSQRDCPGPDSPRAGLGAAGNSLKTPQWQDGKGNIIDPPPDQKVVLPHELKLPRCGPGVTVEIPANSILDPGGNLATAPIQVSIATVDLLSPQQMPGDYSAIGSAGAGRMESFGAGSLDLPPGFTLKPTASAVVTIPVDRSKLTGSLPPAVPLLSYDEQKGLWVQEDTLTLGVTGGMQAYRGKVRHFSVFNADTVIVAGAACLRVFSPSLPGQYDLEAITPYPDGTPHYKKYPIANVAPFEHVVYNITPNVNITLAPMTQGATPNLLGYYIVNSGPPQNPSNAPDAPPLVAGGYPSCQNFVVLKVGSAPDSPFGGEFLHGLGFIAATNLGFDDLTAAAPTDNALRDAIVAASKAYYLSVDPNGDRDTFGKFKSKHGFDQNPAVSVAGEVVAQYANSGDLGFGRDMHCLKKVSGDVACYVSNYGDGYKSIPPGGGTVDQDDANAAGQRATVGVSAEVATVAMEYSPIENDASGDKVVKFFVYKKGLANYGRSISANLDGRGERPVPQLCMICHGGQIPQQTGGVPTFGSAAQVKFNSRFLPFDHRFFTFPTGLPGLTRANQEASIKNLNEQMVNAAPPAAATDPIREVVGGMYSNGTSATQILNFTVPGWVNGASANAPSQAAFYQGVVANECRGCHIAQPFPQLQFNTSDKFLNVSTAVTANNRLMLGTAQLRVCGDYVMPHALRTHDLFWDVYPWDVTSWGPPPTPFPTQFQNFGDGVGGSTWKGGLCTSFINSLVSTPSQFYQHTIQPIWNGKCVACHVAGGFASFRPLTEGVSYGELVPAKVKAGDDNPAAAGNVLLDRITRTGGGRMPQNCIPPPTPPGAGQLPCLAQSDIDKIKAWIRNGAN